MDVRHESRHEALLDLCTTKLLCLFGSSAHFADSKPISINLFVDFLRYCWFLAMFSAASLIARRTGSHAQRRFGSLASRPWQHRSLNSVSSFNVNNHQLYQRAFSTEKPDLPPLPPTPPKGSPAAHPANQLKGHVNDAQGRYYRDWAWNKYINIETVAVLLAAAVVSLTTSSKQTQ